MVDPSSSRASGWFRTSTTSSCRTVAPFASRPELDPTAAYCGMPEVAASPTSAASWLVSNMCSDNLPTWGDGRTWIWAGRSRRPERCAELLGVDLATVGALAAGSTELNQIE